MDKIFASTETKVKQTQAEPQVQQKQAQTTTQIQQQTSQQKEQISQIQPQKSVIVQSAPPQNSYIKSFENMTVADVKREEEQKKAEEFKKEKEQLIFNQRIENKKEKNELIQNTSKENTYSQNRSKSTQSKLTQSMQKSSTNIIEKPNYDLIQENAKVVKISGVKKQKKSKTKTKKIAGIALACAVAISAVICVTNTVIIDELNSQYVQIDENYSFNLVKYLRNIYNLDNAKNSMEMIETYPDELLEAGDTGEKSNWFDRLCNFISGIFGG